MRVALATFVFIVLLPVFALADAGHRADLKMVIDFGDLFGQLSAVVPPDSSEDGSPAQEIPSSMEMMGKMFWTEDMMRLDLDPIEGVSESTITDTKNMVSYKLDHTAKTATRIDLADFSDELGSSFDMPDPETMAADWDSYLESLRAIDGATINELAPKAVNGYQCKGVSFVVTPPAPTQTMDDEEAPADDDADMTGMLSAMTAALGGYSGEVWVAEGIRMPISMQMSMMMMNYNWDLTNIEEQNLDPALFQVPEDYEIVEMQLPDMSEMPDFSDTPAPEPAPSEGKS